MASTPEWHKSSYSGGNAGACVEVAETNRDVYVRDTQHRHHGHLAFPSTEWAAFLRDLKLGHL
ncbi:DUF397 domain-containing protein [Marinitenerispora sediminis]|uniref:DUF397 domain-containing protein n=1 Tax=Marinitenerispora sediminis TaxID=1931232 RepID=A0A368T337_9ACTN|nr:DUF397 domain-containing protein [Marinitenerispora sediminis]RCV55972.1 DUF397 domain-containing protein [Marinitenerispora sediminis]RCV56272.1 DUF397 domain-containing protein [Marinitenerispora sediminis]RCV61204.1 DUF397 domain-containing protein [Marinitenerispora sediminis]